jgi:hypothetical protein
MQLRFHSTSRLLILLALLFGTLSAGTARAALPGDKIIDIRSTSPLAAGQSLTTELYNPGPANIRLQVSGGSADDAITLTLQGGAEPVSWAARSGETIWTYANLPASGQFVLKNTGSAPLNFSLTAYSQAIAPSFGEDVPVLSGTSLGNGTQSAAQISLPSSGLYRFALNTEAGSYQLRVDGSYLVKTVVAGKAPAPEDSTYYLNAGVHTFVVAQDPTTGASNWNVAVTPIGGTDALPSGEQSQVLGGGTFFSEEIAPLQIASAQAVNIRVAVTGDTAASLQVELRNGADVVFTSSPIFGGEVAWGSGALAAGANSLRVVTRNGNAAALSYAVTISPIAETPFNWAGTSYGSPAHTTDGRSTIRMTFPKDGLYRFTLGASAGRYQLLLNEKYLQKTVTNAGAEFTTFVPAGLQTLVVVQDPAATATNWSVAVAATDQTVNSLPFTSGGTTVGGTSNAFTEEWIPVQVTDGAPVNVQVKAVGQASDALRVEVYQADTAVYNAATIYGGETFWGSTALAKGKNLIHIVAAGANTAQMSYEITLHSIANIPAAWSGVTHGNGLRSTVVLNAPVAGTYAITLTLESGIGRVLIDPATVKSRGYSILGVSNVQRVQLSAGTHTFVFQQDSNQPVTNWSLSTSLRRADPVLTIGQVTPLMLTVGKGGRVTVAGQGFSTDMKVELVAPGGAAIAVSDVAVSSSTELSFTAPSSLPRGTYGVRVSNSIGTVTSDNALSVGEMRVYLPFMNRRK